MSSTMIEFLCSDASESYFEYILNILPKKRTKVMNLNLGEDNLLRIKLYTACFTVEEIKSWIREFQDAIKTTFSIRSTVKCLERYVGFKQMLKCHHNTQSNNVCELSQNKRNKNTNCPASMTVTLHSIKKRYRGKDVKTYLIRKDMPCEVSMVLTHNHPTGSTEALQFRRVAPEVREKLIELFHRQHSPATAWQILRSEIYLSHENPELILADRQQCPDYNFCHYLYLNEFIKKHGPLDFAANPKEFLKKRLDDYNAQNDGNSAQVVFNDSDYIICICPPIMKRIHKYIEASSEIVFVDSSGTLDHDGCKIFILLTQSPCGGLPLGVIITSSESCGAMKLGLQLLEKIVGDTIFGGNPEGPKIFITEDSQAEQDAISEVWPNSKCILCIFHVLHSVRRWLVKSKNKVPKELQDPLFEQFKSIMYAKTVEDCFIKYEIAQNFTADYPNYQNHLKNYWERKELWVLPYRNNIETYGNNINNLSEPIMRIIKEKIFNHVRAFNVIQMVDFILTKFTDYYSERLLAAANNRLVKHMMGKTKKLPPDGLMERIEILTDSIIVVPSETLEKLHYFVDMNALICTCTQENTEKLCKHIDWACLAFFSEKYNKPIDNASVRRDFYLIATGKEPPSNWLMPNTLPIVSPQPQTDIKSKQQYVERVRAAIDRIETKCMDFLEKSPNEVVDGLENFCDNLENLHTTSDFVSSCTNFALEYQHLENESIGISGPMIAKNSHQKILPDRSSSETTVETIKIIICP